MNRLVSAECQCLHYYLCRLLWTQYDDGHFAAMFLLELDSLLESILFVRVDYELGIRSVDRFPVRSYPDAGCCVWDAPHAYDNLQPSTTFPSRNPRDA